MSHRSVRLNISTEIIGSMIFYEMNVTWLTSHTEGVLILLWKYIQTMNYNLDLSFLRDWQKHFFKNYKKRNVLVVHRRGWKTIVTIAFLLFKALRVKGDYWYVAPFRSQAKKIAWKALINMGGNIPWVEKNISELILKLPNGSTISLFGADNQDSLRGLDLRWVVLDEYKDISPTLYSEVIAPMINAYKDGWTVWIGTPWGKNQFYDIYQKAIDNPDKYYCAYNNVYETALLDKEQLADAIDEGTDENWDDASFRQEYLLDWDVASKYAYFRQQVQQLWKDPHRISPSLYNKGQPVYTAWDIWINDYTCIVFFQIRNNEAINIIDFYKNRGHWLDHYHDILTTKYPYKYKKHFLPHDAKAREWTSGTSRQEKFEDLFWIDSSFVLTKIPIADWIEAVRTVFPLLSFDASLADYINIISEWSPKIGKDWLPTSTPEHCDVTDTIRYLATSINQYVKEEENDEEVFELDYSELI